MSIFRGGPLVSRERYSSCLGEETSIKEESKWEIFNENDPNLSVNGRLVEDQVISNETISLLKEKISKLTSGRQKQILTLLGEGHSQAEISRMLGISSEAVHQHTRDGRFRLKGWFDNLP